ncbi:hypothetical protein BpHYR1_043241 [Brachionus plicatilis]|uniref:Uncharacterized protein n=1 Tax=Brachionus plicatilis TaxID=10195 RepID=A0A3M7R2P1_BRAPC|nr:hypothetical protein BpHYR1_043241 [Brachionus plicatilis]
MAMDYLGIMPPSIPSERCFSIANLTIDKIDQILHQTQTISKYKNWLLISSVGICTSEKLKNKTVGSCLDIDCWLTANHQILTISNYQSQQKKSQTANNFQRTKNINQNQKTNFLIFHQTGSNFEPVHQTGSNFEPVHRTGFKQVFTNRFPTPGHGCFVPRNNY